MRKIIAATVCTTVILIVAGLSAACKNPPIFAAIEQEIKLKPASVKGTIRGIVCIGNTVYVSNGQIFYKSLGERGTWSKLGGTPGGFCTSIATDGSSLYAAFGDNNSFGAYKLTGSEWQRLSGQAGSAERVMGNGTVFAIKKEGSSAYAVCPVGGSTHTRQSPPIGAAGSSYVCADGLYTSSGSKAADYSNVKAICKGPSGVFVVTNAYLYPYSVAHGVQEPQSVAYLASKKLVLIGGKNGFKEYSINSGSFIQAGGANSSIPYENRYQYENSIGKHLINPIATFEQPNGGYIIYTGVNDSNVKHSGLWGFYKPGQLEWNRE